MFTPVILLRSSKTSRKKSTFSPQDISSTKPLSSNSLVIDSNAGARELPFS